MENITKSFNGVRALNGVSIDIFPGEIHCIVGENGAGKSTLMKVLSGAYSPDSGKIEVDACSYRSLNPVLSKQLGIEIVYQENLLVPTMNIVENIFVGCEESRFGFSKFKSMKSKASDLLDELGLSLDLTRRVEGLSVAEQQYVKILKALVKEPVVLILDEPTSMFNVRDSEKILVTVQQISKKGISVLYISHYLKEVVRIADRITVLRDGAVVTCFDNTNHDVPLSRITQEMVGRSIDMFYVKSPHKIDGTVLRVEDLRVTKDSPSVSFELRRGEILGLAGMIGSGRTEMIRAMIGADRKFSGRIILNNKEVSVDSPRESIRCGIAYVTEDRQKLGLMMGASIVENLTIVGLMNKIHGYFVNYKHHVALIDDVYRALRIKAQSPLQEVRYLSGGNQQKVVLGKWLFEDSDIFILDEPTRGIDVGAKNDFYGIMSNLVEHGKSIIMISSDMPELISMSDRVIVIRAGRIVKELSGEDITEQNVITYALEVNANE